MKCVTDKFSMFSLYLVLNCDYKNILFLIVLGFFHVNNVCTIFFLGGGACMDAINALLREQFCITVEHVIFSELKACLMI